MSAALNFDTELERLDLLAAFVSGCRNGQEASEAKREQLRQLERRVRTERAAPPWADLSRRHGLAPIDLDILSCCLAPEADPHLGWTFQRLQVGIGSPFPTPALVRELLFVSRREAPAFCQRLTPSAPLVRSGLLDGADPIESYRPLRPSAASRQFLLGHERSPTLPGALAVEPRAAWAQLVLPDHARRAVREYLLWVTHRDQVERGWGARLGGGPVALFAGPSGTGKSFAAEVIATELGYALFRVDLGLLVSKYVGETEKNLSALFDAAHGQRCVLLFDEADSLFGRRGEVRDARDRYANLEVSHLLSRIERHVGPCVLTTNLREQLDPAFARRFQTVVEFALPDVAARAALWRLHLPARAPIATTVDIDQLAGAVRLTGGQIRNAANHAAFLAAGEVMPITPTYLAQAVWNELRKQGGEVPRRSLGSLEAFLPEAAAA